MPRIDPSRRASMDAAPSGRFGKGSTINMVAQTTSTILIKNPVCFRIYEVRGSPMGADYTGCNGDVDMCGIAAYIVRVD